MRFHEIPFLKLFIGLVAGIRLYPYFIIENILGLWLISTLFIGISFFINRNEKLSALVFYPFFICLIVAFLFFNSLFLFCSLSCVLWLSRFLSYSLFLLLYLTKSLRNIQSIFRKKIIKSYFGNPEGLGTIKIHHNFLTSPTDGTIDTMHMHSCVCQTRID